LAAERQWPQQEIKRITGVEVREAGTVVKVFTSGTVVPIFLRVRGVPAEQGRTHPSTMLERFHHVERRSKIV
jgi:hypothetical protein